MEWYSSDETQIPFGNDKQESVSVIIEYVIMRSGYLMLWGLLRSAKFLCLYPKVGIVLLLDDAELEGSPDGSLACSSRQRYRIFSDALNQIGLELELTAGGGVDNLLSKRSIYGECRGIE